MRWPWQLQKSDSGYSIFTTEFDVELTGDELGRELSAKDRTIWQAQIDAYQAATELERTRAALISAARISDVLAQNNDFRSTTVSIVVDHSGSLKGQRAIIACLMVQMIGDFLSRLGVKFEILGFTTAAWKGGNSRKRWISKGRPKNPGRLNDLLHICYRKASSTNPGCPWSIHHILRSAVLKENIDGEAVFWAAERLKNQGSDQNLIIVISDGAPVDDSTLHENGTELLWRHLESVVSDVVATQGFRIAGIGIDHDVSRLYPINLKVDRLEQISTKLPDFLGSLFS
ncbi:cobaltochelatase CobT-related protein [Parasedimentitalea maritima]|uniref:cobaltochelatase CobT-related protein n=1 Tax=Parasedimentitalea maritima TaxID=2578117 RepID=UPI001BB0E2D0|nr:hypothetical protein [Zongyanglinia marina]